MIAFADYRNYFSTNIKHLLDAVQFSHQKYQFLNVKLCTKSIEKVFATWYVYFHRESSPKYFCSSVTCEYLIETRVLLKHKPKVFLGTC